MSKAYLLAAPGKPLKTESIGLDLSIDVPPTAPNSTNSVIVVECVGEPKADPVRLLSTTVPVNTLHVFDGIISSNLRFGPGKKSDDVVQQWKQLDGVLTWPVRLTEKATFHVAINYDAPGEIKAAKVTEGDAGKETQRAQKGAAGTYVVTIHGQEFTNPVRTGNSVKDTLGTITLNPGTYEIRVIAKEITGSELFRPRTLTLKTTRD